MSWPFPVDHLLHYRVALKECEFAVKSIKVHFAAFTFTSRALGHTADTSDFRFRKMLEGLTNEVGPQAHRRQPITPNILRGLLELGLRYVLLDMRPHSFTWVC